MRPSEGLNRKLKRRPCNVATILENASLPLRSFFESIGRLLKLVRRPDRDDFTTSTKITLMGIGLLGVIGFIIKFMSAILIVARPVTP